MGLFKSYVQWGSNQDTTNLQERSTFYLCNYWQEGRAGVFLKHSRSVLVSLKPAEAWSINRFVKKPRHDLLSPHRFTSHQIMRKCGGKAATLQKLSQLWITLKALSERVRAVSSYVPECFAVIRHDSHFLCKGLMRKKLLLLAGNWDLGLKGIWS